MTTFKSKFEPQIFQKFGHDRQFLTDMTFYKQYCKRILMTSFYKVKEKKRGWERNPLKIEMVEMTSC